MRYLIMLKPFLLDDFFKKIYQLILKINVNLWPNALKIDHNQLYYKMRSKVNITPILTHQ